MIDYFRKLKIVNYNTHNSEDLNKMAQAVINNKIKINNIIDVLTNEEKEVIVNRIKEKVSSINPKGISITRLEETISAYLFLLQFDLPTRNLNPIVFLVNRGVFWELFKYKYKYKIQILKLGIQLNNLEAIKGKSE